jgi:hypothetical protein
MQPNDFQPIKGVAKSHQQTALSIVVRDGNTDHLAKDQTGMRRGQSSHARGTAILNESVSRTQSALGTKTEKHSKNLFRNLARLLDAQMLGKAFRKLIPEAAPGMGGVTHSKCAENLKENLRTLELRLKGGTSVTGSSSAGKSPKREALKRVS